MTNNNNYPHLSRPWMKFYEEKKVGTIDPKTNLADYVFGKNRNNLGGTAETYYRSKISYRDLFSEIDSYSKALTALGVRKGKRVLYLVPNIPESGALWLAGSQIGAISDFVDPRPDSMDLYANSQKLLEIIKFEKADFIFALDKCYVAMLKLIENELKELGINKIVIISATSSMSLIGKIDYLKDVIRYNDLRNQRITDESVKKLKAYEALLDKMQAMTEEKKAYKEAVKSSPLEIITLEDLVRSSSSTYFTKSFDENAISYIGHTSGTSGARPKPITLTNANQISGTEQLFKAGANFQVGDIILHELPFFSPLGADNNYILNLASGANSIDIPEFEINEFGFLVQKYHPNVILGTPSWIASLPKCRYLDNEDLSCITRIIYGGDSMSQAKEEEVNNWLRAHGSSAEVEKGHGMSEYCGCGSYAQGEYNKPDTMGIPLPDTIYSIVDPKVEDRLVPIEFKDDMDYLEGELVVSSPAVTEGVLDGNVIVPHFEMDGRSYIRTRDLVKMNHDGIFTFDARKDRSFTRFDGYKIKPYEIEKVVGEHPEVASCYLVQYFDEEKRGLMPIVHLVLKGEAELSADDKVALVESIVYNQIICNPHMSSRQIPSKFRFRESMPLTRNSKVSFNTLIDEGLDGTEITVNVEETNLSVGEISIYAPGSKRVRKISPKK